MITKLTPGQNSLRVAELLYHTDDFLFPFLFGSGDKALRNLAKLIEAEHNSFSHNHIYAKTIEGQIVGIVNVFDPSKIQKKLEDQEMAEVFSDFEMIVLFLKSLFLRPLGNKKEVDGLYLQALSVDESQRGKGIGTELIQYVFDLAKQLGYSSVWLDVDFGNPRAKQLYQKMGFEVVSQKRLWPFWTSGVDRMRKPID